MSKEHIPPQKAFNDHRTILVPFEEAIKLGPDEDPRGATNQGGISRYTLCEKCNSDTGSWYGASFVEWCYQVMDLLLKTDDRPIPAYVYRIYPLRVLKQIVTMFFSVASENLREEHPYLVQFVLNKSERFLPDCYRFFVYYHFGPVNRYIGATPIYEQPSGRYFHVSEICYPPFGYVMTLGTPPPDPRLLEITYFGRYRWENLEEIELRPSMLPVKSILPGDYSTVEELRSGEKHHTLIQRDEMKVLHTMGEHLAEARRSRKTTK